MRNARTVRRGIVYKSRSRRHEQGWKDSHDAIVYEDGRIVHPPISTCASRPSFTWQNFGCRSSLVHGDRDLARKCWTKPNSKSVSMTLSACPTRLLALGDFQARLTSGSPRTRGTCWSVAVVRKEAAPRVARRFLQDDMFSGWVSDAVADHPTYDPYSCPCGAAVWPVEHGRFAMAMMRLD